MFFNEFFKEALYRAGLREPGSVFAFFSLMMLIPFVFIKDYHKLANVGYFAAVLMAFSFLYMIYRDLSIDIKHVAIPINFSGSLYFIGVGVFSYEGVGCVFHIRETMY